MLEHTRHPHAPHLSMLLSFDCFVHAILRPTELSQVLKSRRNAKVGCALYEQGMTSQVLRQGDAWEL